MLPPPPVQTASAGAGLMRPPELQQLALNFPETYFSRHPHP